MPSSLPYSNQILVTASRLLVNRNHYSQVDQPTEADSLIENQHLGWLVVNHRQHGILHCTPGALETATFFRSSAKPFQAFPLVDAGYSQQLTQEELAIACASHTATPRHVALARQILQKAGLSESCLQCGPHAPIDSAERAALISTGQAPRAIHNNCSGKHAAMLFYCQQAALDVSTYLEPMHPLQQKIVDVICDWGQVDSIPLALDGCGAPVFYLSLQTMALLYGQLANAPEFSPLLTAMTTFPEVVGAEGRVDTVIMQASQGRLVAKVGADGVLCVGRAGTDEGLALKIADGTAEVRDFAVVEILRRLGWLDVEMMQDARLRPYVEALQRKNTQGKVVGGYQVHFKPGSTSV